MQIAITLKQIQGFLAAARYLSFSQAAAELHMSQSAFSQLIRETEATLDVRLFDRTTRRVALTDAGIVLRRKLELGVAEISEACAEARAIARIEFGQLVIGTLASLAIGIVTQVLVPLRLAYPGLRVSLREDYNGALVSRVLQGEVDFAVCAYSGEMQDLQFEHLYEDQLVLIMRADDALLLQQEVSWDALRAVSLVLTVRQSSTREQVSAAMKAQGSARSIDYDVENMFTALSLVRAGLGATFIPLLSVGEVNMKELTWRKLRDPVPSRQIGICRRTDRSLSPAAEKFVQYLREQAKQLASRNVSTQD